MNIDFSLNSCKIVINLKCRFFCKKQLNSLINSSNINITSYKTTFLIQNKEMEKLRFKFVVLASIDGKSNVISITSIETPHGKIFDVPDDMKPIKKHTAILSSEVYPKIKKTLQRIQTCAIWIKMNTDLRKAYLDESDNVKFGDKYLQKIKIATIPQNNSNSNKPWSKNMGKIAERYLIEKFSNKTSIANQWIIEFEIECVRFEIKKDEEKIEMLKYLLDKQCLDWYRSMIIKITVNSEWTLWKNNFCESYGYKETADVYIVDGEDFKDDIIVPSKKAYKLLNDDYCDEKKSFKDDSKLKLKEDFDLNGNKESKPFSFYPVKDITMVKANADVEGGSKSGIDLSNNVNDQNAKCGKSKKRNKKDSEADTKYFENGDNKSDLNGNENQVSKKRKTKLKNNTCDDNRSGSQSVENNIGVNDAEETTIVTMKDKSKKKKQKVKSTERIDDHSGNVGEEMLVVNSPNHKIKKNSKATPDNIENHVGVINDSSRCKSLNRKKSSNLSCDDELNENEPTFLEVKLRKKGKKPVTLKAEGFHPDDIEKNINSIFVKNVTKKVEKNKENESHADGKDPIVISTNNEVLGFLDNVNTTNLTIHYEDNKFNVTPEGIKTDETDKKQKNKNEDVNNSINITIDSSVVKESKVDNSTESNKSENKKNKRKKKKNDGSDNSVNIAIDSSALNETYEVDTRAESNKKEKKIYDKNVKFYGDDVSKDTKHKVYYKKVRKKVGIKSLSYHKAYTNSHIKTEIRLEKKMLYQQMCSV